MKRTILLCVGIAAAVPIFLFPRLAQGEDVIFEQVAGPNTEAPGGGYYQYLHSASLDEERAVFQAQTSLYVDGIWAYEKAKFTTVADTDTLVPGSVVHFSAFDVPVQHAGETAFFGQYPEYCDLGPCGGIFRAGSAGLTRIADTNDTVPDRNDTYEYLSQPAIGEDGVAYRGGMVIQPQGYPEYVYGVYADLGSGPVTVADWETPTPFGTGHLYLDYYEGHIAVYQGEVYFQAYNTGNYRDGYYAWDALSDTYRVLRNAETLVPGTQSYFDWATGDAFRNGTFAFIGDYWTDDYQQGVFADFGEGLTTIVSDDELSSDWYGGEVEIESLAVNGDTLAFTVYDYWYYGANRLYLYRHSDETLYPIIGSGDTLDDRVVERVDLYWDGAGDEAVAFLVQFRDHWERELYVASLHTPKHDVLAGPDMDGNGYDEVILLRQESDDHSYLLQVRDAFTGGMSAMISLGDFPVYDIALVENAGQAAEVAVYGKKHNGRLIVKFFSLADGSFLRTLSLWKDMTPIAMAVLPDMNGNGAPEIAAMAETSQPFIRVKIFDSLTGDELNTISHGKSLRPVSIFTTDDLNASGAPELVIMGIVRSTAKVRLIVQDAADGTVLSDFFAGYDDKAPVLDEMLVDDLGDTGAPEILLSRARLEQGKANYEARDLLSGSIVVDKKWVTDDHPLKVTAVEDLTADGRPEIALLMVAPDGKTQIRIHDLATNSLVDTMDMLSIEAGWGLITTPDIDASQTEELVALGEHFGADMIEIRDCADGDPLRYYVVP